MFRFDHISEDLLKYEQDDNLLQTSLLDNSNLESTENENNNVVEENEVIFLKLLLLYKYFY